MERYKSPKKEVGGNEGDKCHYSIRVDTYGKGCSHDCSYCYAKSLLDFRGLWNPDFPAVSDIRVIREQIRKIPRSQIIRLGGMTDCFQPIEKIYRTTYKTLLYLKQRRHPYLIVTKSAIISDDEYTRALDKELAHIQITVTTTDDELAKTYEKASAPSL